MSRATSTCSSARAATSRCRWATTGVLLVDTSVEQMSRQGRGRDPLALRQADSLHHQHPRSPGSRRRQRSRSRKLGATIAGGNMGAGAGTGASILSHENVLNRMTAPTGQQAPTPTAAWPTDTYFTKQKELFFNGEAIEIIHQPAAHTDGDSIVFFRRSDVLSAGDLFGTTTYPVIDLERGGNIQGDHRRPEHHARHHDSQGQAGRRHLCHSRPRPSLRRSRRPRVPRHGHDHSRSHPGPGEERA